MLVVQPETDVRKIDGDVYDVSKGKAYQPGGSYHFMSVFAQCFPTRVLMLCQGGHGCGTGVWDGVLPDAPDT